MDLMKMSAKERTDILELIKERYPIGVTVELISMNDTYVDMPKGLKGTVKSIDDIGTIHISWENGSSLGAVYGEDEVKVFLYSCPFCGSKHISFNISQIIPQKHHQIYCSKCGAGTMGHPDKLKVIDLWNKRVNN